METNRSGYVMVDKSLLTEAAFKNMLIEWPEYPYAQEDALDSFLELLKAYIENRPNNP